MNNIQMIQLAEEKETSSQSKNNKQSQIQQDEIIFKQIEFQQQQPPIQKKRIKKMTVQKIFEKNDRQARLKTHKREVDLKNVNALQKLKITKQSKKFSKHTVITIISTIFQASMAFLASILYIINTYYVEHQEMEPTFILWETLFGIVFLIDYLWNFYRSQDKVKFFFKIKNLIDLITIIPTLLNQIPPLTSKLTVFLAGFVGIVRVTRIFRVFRIYKLYKESQEQNYSLREYWEVKRKQLVIISQLFVSLLVAAGLIQVFHELEFGFQIGHDKQLSFDQALYYITVTCATVGYGDLTPANELSQVIVLIFIVFIIYTITKTTTDFNELSNITSKYKLPYEGHQKKHVFLIGNVNPENFITFAKEFYHPDICQDQDVPLLIMLPQEPNNVNQYQFYLNCIQKINQEWRSIFKSSHFLGKVYYLVGNPLKKSDLLLAKLTSNKIMIFVDQFSIENTKEDSFALLATQVISDLYPRCQIFTQVNSKENLFWNFWHGQKSLTSSNLLTMGTITQNVFIPGFSTMISNLSMSLSESNQLVEDYSPWKLEFIEGMSNEIYIFDFKEDKNNCYVGKSFQQACLEIYNKTGILMIGLKIKNKSLSQECDHFDIVINPIDHNIGHEDFAIILAKNYNHCQQIIQTASNELGELREQESYVPNYHQINGQIESFQFQEFSEGNLEQTFFRMSKLDMRKQISNHILIIGEIAFAEHLIEELRTKTNLAICYVSKNPPDEQWEVIKRKQTKLYYFECQYFNIDELERTAIRNSFHTLIMCGREGSELSDSKILPLANIISENFQEVSYTLCLRKEKNVKYIISRVIDEGIQLKNNQNYQTVNGSYTNPLFASSKIFYNSQIYYQMARSLHFNDFGNVLEKLISPHLYPNLSKISENNYFSYVQIPYSLSNLYTYQQVFDFFIRKKIIPVALYRKAFSLDNEEDFVYTNPNPQAPILKGDLLIVIGNSNFNKETAQINTSGNVIKLQSQESLSLQEKDKNKKLNRKLIEQMKLGLIGLMPELNIFSEERDSSEQKGLSRIQSISKNLIEMNQKFNLKNQQSIQYLCEQLNIYPEQIHKLNELNQKLQNLINDNQYLRLNLAKKIADKAIASRQISISINYQREENKKQIL
ncbi:hypothetical protein ABPG72_003645 [Tetrahymena utriculariae]